MVIQNLDWLKAFPETQTSLECLNFATIKSKVGEVEFKHLEALVDRCRSLKRLKLNKEMSLDQLRRILVRAPQLVELGTGVFSHNGLNPSTQDELLAPSVGCKNIRPLSGLWDIVPYCLHALIPIYQELLTLDLSNIFLPESDFSILISYCKKLQRLLVGCFSSL